MGNSRDRYGFENTGVLTMLRPHLRCTYAVKPFPKDD